LRENAETLKTETRKHGTLKFGSDGDEIAAKFVCARAAAKTFAEKSLGA
jgi:hypothetical protein